MLEKSEWGELMETVTTNSAGDITLGVCGGNGC